MKRTILFLALFLAALTMPCDATEKEDVKRGNILYNSGDYAGALKLYEKAALEKKSAGIPEINRGAALYKDGSYYKAIEAFNKSIASGQADLIPAADYNIGNATYKIGLSKDKADKDKKNIKKTAEIYATALLYYKRAIDLDPDDKDAKFNYEYVLKKLLELSPLFQIKQEEEKQKEKDKEKNKEDKKDQNQENQQSEQNKQDEQNQQDKEQQDKDKNQQDRQNKQDQQQQDKQDKKDKGQQDEQNKSAQQSQEEQAKKEQEEEAAEEAREEQAKKEQEEQAAKEAQEEQAAEEARKEQGSEASEKPEDKQGGLAAYQGAEKQVDPREMTEQEAKMLLEGYKGEEATGRTIKMRQKPIDMPEPARDW